MPLVDLIRRPAPKKLSVKDFLKSADEHIAELQALAMFADIGEASTAERLARAEVDFDYFCTSFLPHFFGNDKAEWHDEFDDDFETQDVMTAITAMRGGGKSTRAFAHELHWILFRKRRHIVHCLDTYDKSVDYTRAILIELQHNERLKHDFGQMVSMQAAYGDFVCFDPLTHRTTTRVRAFGISMGFRGLKDGADRPDVIIFEDLQADREAAENEDRTAKIIRIILGDAYGAMVPTGWTFIVLGNVICKGSLMDELLHPEKYKAWKKRRYPAIVTDSEGNRRSTFPSRFTLELLDKMRVDLTDKNGDAMFEVEYMCRAVEVGKVFQEQRDIHYYESLPQEIDLSNVLVQIDQGESGYNDFTAIIAGVSYVHDANRPDFGQWKDTNGKPFGEGIYNIVLEIFLRQVGIDETIDQAYEIISHWKCFDSHWDGSVDKELIWERFISSWEVRNGISLPVTFDRFDVKKELRIKAVQPSMQRRKTLLPPQATEDRAQLLTQLLRFGNSNQHDDGPDCLAALVENLDPLLGSTEITELGGDE